MPGGVDLSLSYSFGGTRDEPLVARTVPCWVSRDAIDLQEILLDRTDALLRDLCVVYDDAQTTFDAAGAGTVQAAAALQKMMGAVSYATKNVLAQSPSVKYAFMFVRIQALMSRLGVVGTWFGPDAAQTVTDFMRPVWSVLRMIDDSFTRDGDVCDAGIEQPTAP